MASQALRLVPGSVILTAPRLVSLLEPSMTCKQTLPSISCWSACHFHSSPGSTTTADTEITQPEDETSTSSSSPSIAAADTSSSKAAARGPVHARHISLNDPELNIRLTHNKKFVMDADRQYAIGQANHLDRQIRLELRKALAAQRLQLRDAAAAAPGTKQLPLRDQMLSRLTELQQATRR